MVKFMACLESREQVRLPDGRYTPWVSRVGLEALRAILAQCAAKGDGRDAVADLADVGLERLGVASFGDRCWVALRMAREAFEEVEMRGRLAEVGS